MIKKHYLTNIGFVPISDYVHRTITRKPATMYLKNRVPMYEGDGFIHSSPKPDNCQIPFVEAARNPHSQAELRPGLRGAARQMLRKLAVYIGTGVRHLLTKALER